MRMNEPQWLECTYPEKLLIFLRGKASARKLRLFAVACCRRIWDILQDPRSRAAVEAAERFADGDAPGEELRSAFDAAGAAIRENHMGSRFGKGRAAYPDQAARHAASRVVHARAAADWAVRARSISRSHCKSSRLWHTELAAQASLLRDLFGNPFRPAPVVEATWREWSGRTVVDLARAADDCRCLPAGTLDTTRLAVLSDALEEAGCTNPDILDHLRGPGPHVRGCFVVDALLGKN
jgi:hypothetical protein